MTSSTSDLQRILKFITEHNSCSIDQLIRELAQTNKTILPRIPSSKKITLEALERRWKIIEAHTESTKADKDLLLPSPAGEYEVYGGNIENFIGLASLPMGVIGPLKIRGAFARGEFYVPLATTEAALIASYNRGAQVIGEAGGCISVVLHEGVSRAPAFIFKDLLEVGQFILWLSDKFETFKAIADSTTQYGKLVDMDTVVEGNHVYIRFEYTTGDASGQNMVTFATDHIYQYIIEHTPVIPKHAFIEGNLSGDKKPNSYSLQSVRGKKVTTEVCIPQEVIKKLLHTTPEKMAQYWTVSVMGGVLTGSMGLQGHIANGLAALYIATGQDAACVSESSVGITRVELQEDGSLYACLTMPNIITGTVGGGTKLPSQSAALRIMNCYGAGNSRKFAEICAAVCLCGELSIMGAMCADHFARAHKNLARGK